ncbi:MAG TPA: ferric reductase-like transmembrane domain-containing protein [Acetobacteraceae bacterium]|nr:ferric reductase-like transmembrane domain-containing protein [Acetobacteraceae bacterium]
MRATGLVRDPAGRFSWLKTAVLLFAVSHALVLGLRWQMHALGPRPITEAIHVTGLWALRFLLLSLAVTPARAVLDWGRVVMLRRMLGVAAACYAVAHLTLYALDQRWRLLHVAHEIAVRFYLTIGFVALLGLLALAITSTDGWQRHLGARWKKLHRVAYGIAVLGLLHYAIQSKANISDAVLLAGLFAWLMYWRLLRRRWQQKLWPLLGLTLAAGATASVFEAGWYAVRNHVGPLLVWDANFDLSYGPRPSVWVLILGVTAVALAMARRTRKRRGMPRGAVRQA